MEQRIDRDRLFLNIATEVAQRGTCPRASVGALITNSGRIVGMGYNGAPPGMPHCTDVGCETDDHLCTCDDCHPTPFEDVCKYAIGCERTVHSEANAIAFAAQDGVKVDGSSMYCTHAPCYVCAKLIISAGIVVFHYINPYRDTRGVELLDKALVATVPHAQS